jgi:hypothetical protein
MGSRVIPCGDLVPPLIVWPSILDLVPPTRGEDAEQYLTLSVFRQLMAEPGSLTVAPDALPEAAAQGRERLARILSVTSKHGRLSPLQWLECRGLLDGDGASGLCLSACQAAAAHGHVHICAWLHQHNHLTTPHFRAAFGAAALAGQLATVQWVIPLLYPTSAPFEVRKKQFATPDQDGTSMRGTLYKTIKRGHTHVARFLIEHFGFTRANLFGREVDCLLSHVTKYRLLSECVASGDVQFCQWAKARFRFRHNDASFNILFKAARQDLLDMCQWLVTAFNLDAHDVHDAMGIAARHGSRRVCEWLLDHVKKPKPNDTLSRGLHLLKEAVTGDKVDMCLWLAERFQITGDKVRSPGECGFTCCAIVPNDRYGPLIEAAFLKYPALCQWLIDYFGMTMHDIDKIRLMYSDDTELHTQHNEIADFIVSHCTLTNN